MTPVFKTSLIIAAAIAASGSLPALAVDAVKVGAADAVRNDVSSIGGAEIIRVNVGDDVMQDEVLQTKADSDAKIVLLDDTKLSLGPQSTLKIDNAVYSTDKSYSTIGIKLTEGAFRFISGKSEKAAYKIQTPTATIGVRGTILDIRIQKNKTLVTLQDGQAGVCAGTRCVQLLDRGNTANISLINGGVNLKLDKKPTWTFASVCSGNAALCSPLPPLVQRASLPALPGAPSFGDALKGATTAGSLTKPLNGLANVSRPQLPGLPPERSALDTGQPGLSAVNPSLPALNPSLPALNPSLPSLPATPNVGGLLRR